MWKYVKHFCEKNSNALFNENGVLHPGHNNKTSSVKMLFLSKISNSKHGRQKNFHI